ncbi:hypothetical protein J2X67_004083 [Variovorax sp. 3319]|nr:hypothetical protein [Variovorax sp. 3319]
MTGLSYFSLPFLGRAGVGARGATIERPARPHPNLPPKGEGAKP